MPERNYGTGAYQKTQHGIGYYPPPLEGVVGWEFAEMVASTDRPDDMTLQATLHFEGQYEGARNIRGGRDRGVNLGLNVQ